MITRKVSHQFWNQPFRCFEAYTIRSQGWFVYTKPRVMSYVRSCVRIQRPHAPQYIPRILSIFFYLMYFEISEYNTFDLISGWLLAEQDYAWYLVNFEIIHSKSETIGGVYFSGKKMAKKYVNCDNKILRQMCVNYDKLIIWLIK